MIFTGYLLEKLQAMENESVKRLLELADIIVDGPFILAEKNLTLSYRGSENQRVIDMVKTRKTGEVALYRSDYEDLW
jgi:anaerobic ribonucleoside-triphosphate reductase activating protein